MGVRRKQDSCIDGLMARWYAALTRNNLPEFAAEARRVAALLPRPARVLEVAPGPGYFAIELARLGEFRVEGLDISRAFVEMGQRAAREAGVDVHFVLGNAAEMPFDGDAFDFVFCRAAFKNFARPLEALNEMHRVLRRGGKGLIVDLNPEAPPGAIDQAVDQMGCGTINRILTKMIFRSVLLKRAHSRAELEALAAQSAFGRARIEPTSISLEVWLEK